MAWIRACGGGTPTPTELDLNNKDSSWWSSIGNASVNPIRLNPSGAISKNDVDLSKYSQIVYDFTSGSTSVYFQINGATIQQINADSRKSGSINISSYTQTGTFRIAVSYDSYLTTFYTLKLVP